LIATSLNLIVTILIGALGGVGILYVLETQPQHFTYAELQTYDFSKENILVIKPILTANAYKSNGFYSYYNGFCTESCLSVQIDQNIPLTYDSSLRAVTRFEELGATMADDYTINLDELKNYDKIILLHNEYVTQEFFDAVQNHPNVIYMYPNALYGKVEVKDGIMTLIQGHGYNGKDNGFDWKYDNTRPYEFDEQCLTYDWIKIDNGLQLNCYPENFILDNAWVFGNVRDIATDKGQYIRD